jgi:DNA-directed RNA polymerase specialized sigma24 family protein
MDDGTLAMHVERAREGDERSFEILVTALGGMLLVLAYRYTGDWESSGDLIQETWLSVFRALGRLTDAFRFDPGSSQSNGTGTSIT